MVSLRFVIDMFRAHKIRFLLTVSGIVVGVASLILLASLLHVGEAVLQQSSARASGDDVITVANDWKLMQDWPDEKRLDKDDLRSMESSLLLEGNTEVAGVFGFDSVKVQRGNDVDEPLGLGVEPSIFRVHRLSPVQGRLFTQEEYDGFLRVAVAGSDVMKDFGGVKVGEALKINGKPYLIVGVLEEKPVMGPGRRWSWNNRILIPARVFNMDLAQSERINSIEALVTPPTVAENLLRDFVLATRDVMTAILMGPRQNKNFRFGGVQEEDSKEEVIFLTIKVLIFMTTFFSMVVGGINIMNIMLVTVTERTREIGVRRALGATRRDILRQFLAETVGITLTGAVIGVLSALGLLVIAAKLLTRFVAPWPFYVSPWSLALSVGFSCLIGLIFGISPAVRASRLDPVEALRYE